MQYCSKEHQVSDRPSHKRVCNAAKKALQKYNEEEAALRALPADVFYEADPFTNSVGHFWGIHATRDYMRWRYSFVEAIIKVNTYEAVRTALVHLMDMLRLCRGDNMGVRDVVPHLMLRLNEDQRCYDFVKWWATMGEESDYDWGDMDLPYLNIQGADVFEPNPENLITKYSSLSPAVATTLLKIKLIIDLTNMENSAVLVAKAPQEIVDHIQNFVPRSTIVSENAKIMGGTKEYREEIMKKLNTQIEQLFKSVESNNKHFWKALLDPHSHLQKRPGGYTPGSLQEMQLVLGYSYASWKETSGALELVKTRVNTGKWTPVAASP